MRLPLHDCTDAPAVHCVARMMSSHRGVIAGTQPGLHPSGWLMAAGHAVHLPLWTLRHPVLVAQALSQA